MPYLAGDDFILPWGSALFPWEQVSLRWREREFFDITGRARLLRSLADMLQNGTYDRMKRALVQHAGKLNYGYGLPTLGLPLPSEEQKPLPCKKPSFQYARSHAKAEHFIPDMMTDPRNLGCVEGFNSSAGFESLLWAKVHQKVKLYRRWRAWWERDRWPILTDTST
jgi:hypothetical protein